MFTAGQSLFYLSEGALLLCVGAAGGQAWEHDEKLVGTPKHPRCCECHRRFKSEPRRGVWPVIKHNPRCPPASFKQEPPTPAAVTASLCSRKRHAESDPGEPRPRTPSPCRTRPTTTRVTPPTPAQASKKQRTTRQDERIMRLLEETHARRMAAETAATTAAAAAAAVAAGTLAVAGGAAYSRGASQ